MTIALGMLIALGIALIFTKEQKAPVVNVDVKGATRESPKPQPDKSLDDQTLKNIQKWMEKHDKALAETKKPVPKPPKAPEPPSEPGLPAVKDERFEDLSRLLVNLRYSSYEPAERDEAERQLENVMLRIRRLVRYTDQSKLVDNPAEPKPEKKKPVPVIL